MGFNVVLLTFQSYDDEGNDLPKAGKRPPEPLCWNMPSSRCTSPQCRAPGRKVKTPSYKVLGLTRPRIHIAPEFGTLSNVLFGPVPYQCNTLISLRFQRFRKILTDDKSPDVYLIMLQIYRSLLAVKLTCSVLSIALLLPILIATLADR